MGRIAYYKHRISGIRTLNPVVSGEGQDERNMWLVSANNKQTNKQTNKPQKTGGTYPVLWGNKSKLNYNNIYLNIKHTATILTVPKTLWYAMLKPSQGRTLQARHIARVGKEWCVPCPPMHEMFRVTPQKATQVTFNNS